MLNEEQVKLMTKIAAYEQGEGKENIKIANYFKYDYISIQILKTIIYTTIAYGIMIGIYLFYEFEILLQHVYTMNLLDTGKVIIVSYICLIVIFSVITYILYLVRYNRAQKNLKTYYSDLKKLSKYYNER